MTLRPDAFAMRTALVAIVLSLLPLVVMAGEVRVFAAASLRDVLQDVAAGWTAETGHTTVLTFAATSALARQIGQGAPADVFIAASTDWMDRLQADGDADGATRFDWAGNALVLVAHGRNAAPVAIAPGMDLSGLLGDGRLAMALVDAAPAGLYGKAALTSLGVWDAVAPKVAQADTVRAALAFVASGEAPYGIVYATDAGVGDDVSVVGTFPAKNHPPIVYPAAAVVGGDDAMSSAFLDYLRGDAGLAALERWGFTRPAP